jgi:hypothetical protein
VSLCVFSRAAQYAIVRLDVLGLVNTPKFWKPFDDLLSNVMDATTIELCKQFNPMMAPIR